jgi:hypothetical protein
MMHDTMQVDRSIFYAVIVADDGGNVVRPGTGAVRDQLIHAKALAKNTNSYLLVSLASIVSRMRGLPHQLDTQETVLAALEAAAATAFGMMQGVVPAAAPPAAAGDDIWLIRAQDVRPMPDTMADRGWEAEGLPASGEYQLRAEQRDGTLNRQLADMKAVMTDEVNLQRAGRSIVRSWKGMEGAVLRFLGFAWAWKGLPGRLQLVLDGDLTMAFVAYMKSRTVRSFYNAIIYLGHLVRFLHGKAIDSMAREGIARLQQQLATLRTQVRTMRGLLQLFGGHPWHARKYPRRCTCRDECMPHDL